MLFIVQIIPGHSEVVGLVEIYTFADFKTNNIRVCFDTVAARATPVRTKKQTKKTTVDKVVLSIFFIYL